EALRPAVERACDAVEARVGRVPGCLVERKGPTATVHYRRTPPDRVPEVRAAVEAAAGGEPGLRLVRGKQSLEVRPTVDWDKGAAMRRVVEDAPGGWAAVYLGDDTTDEDVFAALEPDDVGVRIGDDADTAAGVTLPGQDAVAPFLAWLDEAVLGEAPRRA
ncbi:MAG TPA: trehalose-phosphatase, partial [Halobacteriales archaeon]|nr:trehalose-phosphatase [Halobacteriales archaeon]